MWLPFRPTAWSIVKRFDNRTRPRPKPEPAARLELDPLQQPRDRLSVRSFRAAQAGMPGGPRISRPWSAAACNTGAMSGGAAGVGGISATGAGVPSVRMKPSNPAACGDQQEASLVGADDERVRHVAWAEHEGACRRDERLARDPDRELALKDVEPLVLLVVDVQRRAGAARRGLLGQHHAAAGSRAIGLDRRQATEEPEVLSLTGTESDGCEGAVRRGRGGVCCVDVRTCVQSDLRDRRRPPPASGDLSCAGLRD